MRSTEPSASGADQATETPAAADPVSLPATPLLIIEGGHRWVPIDWRDLWLHRDLFYFLALRDVKLRYKQTVLGVAWVLLQPLLTTVVFTILFGRLAHVPSQGAPYPIFALAGLLPWNFFNGAVTNSANSLVGNSNLISKVYFPRMLIPAAAVAAALVDFTVASMLLLVLMPCYGVAFMASLLMLLALTPLTVLAALGVGLWLAAHNVKYRDVRYAIPFILQLWMFLTPVIYPVSFVPARWRWVILLNPLSGLIEGFRAAVFGLAMPWGSVLAAAALAAAFTAYALFSFSQMEREFADVI